VDSLKKGGGEKRREDHTRIKKTTPFLSVKPSLCRGQEAVGKGEKTFQKISTAEVSGKTFPRTKRTRQAGKGKGKSPLWNHPSSRGPGLFLLGCVRLTNLVQYGWKEIPEKR